MKTICHCHLRPRTRISDINTTATSSDFWSRQPFDHKHNQKHAKGQKKACVDSPQTHIPHPQTNHPSNTHHNHAHTNHRGVVDMYWRTHMYTRKRVTQGHHMHTHQTYNTYTKQKSKYKAPTCTLSTQRVSDNYVFGVHVCLVCVWFVVGVCVWCPSATVCVRVCFYTVT